MPTVVDHVEAALERLTREEIAALPPARRARLRAILGTWESICHELAQPKPGETTFYVTGDAKERLQAQQRQAGSVIADLRKGHRVE